jgi:hypothetical protein
MNRRLLVLGISMLAAAASASSAQAQRGIHPGSFASVRHFARVHPSGWFYGESAFWPGYYSDYGEPPVIEALPPEIIQVVQPAPPAPPAESLVLELQGDHWVRISNGGQSQSVYATAATIESASPVVRRAGAAMPTAPLPPAVLVFRDGHQEEITRYTIAGSTIVANADYWSTGAWTRKIQIADLNIPETLRLNQQRGAQFRLPSGPNEVIVRP